MFEQKVGTHTLGHSFRTYGDRVSAFRGLVEGHGEQSLQTKQKQQDKSKDMCISCYRKLSFARSLVLCFSLRGWLSYARSESEVVGRFRFWNEGMDE